MPRLACRIALLVAGITGLLLRADPPVIHALGAPPSTDALQAQARLRVAPGLRLSLWAAEPLVQNLTSVSFDEQGRAYAVETGRRRTSVFDIRGFRDWLDDDYDLRTVEQRAAFLRGMLNTNAAFLEAASKGGRGNFKDFNGDGVIDARDLEVESERIRRLWDADGDGRADHAETFADGFTNLVSGVAAGVLARGTNVWFTSIPDLWQYSTVSRDFAPDRGSPGPAPDGQSASPVSGRRLLSGFGVHIAFGGHDLHGLALGPDGRLYFSIADRGSHVTNREGRAFAFPDTGAVFRCEPDGAHFEVYAYGFRNPQELAFDADGQLWTADNNGDGGDKARLLPVLEGADHGWQIGWQWLPRMGPWNAERLWHLAPTNSAAYLVPPVAHVGHGPAGFAYYPGTGLGPRYAGQFFLADFPGGVRTFGVKPHGAGWEVVDAGPWMEDNSSANFTGKLLWELSPVDVTFPPFGGVIVADWVQGWEKTGKGRLWHVTDPSLAQDAVIAETRRLLGEGMQTRSVDGLARLLSHADLRVRQEAHFALAARVSVGRLVDLALRGWDARARLHALWALGIAARTSPISIPELGKVVGLLRDQDAVVRMNAVRLLGEWRAAPARAGLVKALEDPELRVQAAAWVALGTAGFPPPTAAFDRVNWDDPFLFQSVVGHLQRLHGPVDLGKLALHADARVRLAAVIALRRLNSSVVAEFLGDSDPRVVLEAVRAIHDLPLSDALAQLPDLPESLAAREMKWPAGLPFSRPEWNEWIFRRVINATLQMGGTNSAQRLAQWSIRPGLDPGIRRDAMEALGLWSMAQRRDRVVGVSRPRPGHAIAQARDALVLAWPAITNASAPVPVMVAALNSADQLGIAQLPPALLDLDHHPDAAVRAEVARLVRSRRPVTLESVTRQLASGSLRDQQAAFAALSDLPETAATPVLAAWLRQLVAGEAPVQLQADILDAAGRYSSLAPLVGQWSNSLAKKDPLAAYRVALTGGDAQRGHRIFVERADLGCQRCHKLRGEGGDVGPELTGIGRTKGREYVLRALLLPDAEIATGYESTLVTLKSGDTHAGVVKVDNAGLLVLDSPGEGRLTIRPAEIVSRERAPSPMPAGLTELLTLRELRDLIEAVCE